MSRCKLVACARSIGGNCIAASITVRESRASGPVRRITIKANYHQNASLLKPPGLDRVIERRARPEDARWPSDHKELPGHCAGGFCAKVVRCWVGPSSAGGLAGPEALGASVSASNLPPNVPEWTKGPRRSHGKPALRNAFAVREGCHREYPEEPVQYLSASGRTPLQDLDGIITPNGLFYERHHASVPMIDPA